jgi:dCMP deaminase
MINKWDYRYLELAKNVSKWSKDPSTKCGAVIVDTENKIVSTGFNGFPKSVEDYKNRYLNRDLKYQLIIHSEINALLQAKISVSGFSIYSYPMIPCIRCCVTLIQAGITKIVTCHLPKELSIRWGSVFCEKIIKEAKIKLIYINSNDLA